jgi:hypothetical protein
VGAIESKRWCCLEVDLVLYSFICWRTSLFPSCWLNWASNSMNLLNLDKVEHALPEN